MNKKCARCEKTVYSIEELKCLDKLWHKQCFKCQSCGMILNMRNYKGFNKNPYCEASTFPVEIARKYFCCERRGIRRHIPKAKATSVAETPELKRIAENTKIQSNAKYHAEFEKAKGKLTQVADDPETLRLKQNSQIISNVAYHGDLKKKAEMEQKRTISAENGQPNDIPLMNHSNIPVQNPQPSVNQNAYVNKQRNIEAQNVTKNSPYSARQSSTLIYSSNKGPVNVSTSGRSVGSIADLDPVNNFYGSLTSSVPFNEPPLVHQSNYKKSGNVYRAMYDYDARESDEVSFMDGDIILNCVHIHDGWMSGMVQRTGECGLLPANYVESIII